MNLCLQIHDELTQSLSIRISRLINRSNFCVSTTNSTWSWRESRLAQTTGVNFTFIGLESHGEFQIFARSTTQKDKSLRVLKCIF